MGRLSIDAAILKQPFGHVINGKLVTSADDHISVINPATEEEIAHVPVATQDTLEVAVDAACKAFKSWSKTTWKNRANLVQAWSETWQENSPELKKLLTLEQGKSVPVSTHEVRLTI